MILEEESHNVSSYAPSLAEDPISVDRNSLFFEYPFVKPVVYHRSGPVVWAMGLRMALRNLRRSGQECRGTGVKKDGDGVCRVKMVATHFIRSFQTASKHIVV